MSKYDRTIIGRNADGQPVAVTVDVYQVMDAFEVAQPAAAASHQEGALRRQPKGNKDRKTDLKEILDSARRAVEMHEDKEALGVVDE